jgi:hypothetical protein
VGVVADAPDEGRSDAGPPTPAPGPAAPGPASPGSDTPTIPRTGSYPTPPASSPRPGASAPSPTAPTPAAKPPPTSAGAAPPHAASTTTSTTHSGAPKPDWTVQLTDQIDGLVDTIRSNTSDRLVKVARMIVYGLLVAVVGAVALIVVIIGAIRILDHILPYEVWLPYFVLGAIFLGAGLFLWSKREASPADS